MVKDLNTVKKILKKRHSLDWVRFSIEDGIDSNFGDGQWNIFKVFVQCKNTLTQDELNRVISTMKYLGYGTVDLGETRTTMDSVELKYMFWGKYDWRYVGESWDDCTM